MLFRSGIRFVQTDALGAPVSRQFVGTKGWKNDGFIMPNPASRRLFAALLPLLAADTSRVVLRGRFTGAKLSTEAADLHANVSGRGALCKLMKVC